MPKKLQKSFQDYLNKIKKPSPPLQFTNNSFSSSKNWILSSCRHTTKTLSFAIGRNQDKQLVEKKLDNNDNKAARLSDVDRFLFENFKSLYIKDDEDQNYDEKKADKESHDHEGENLSGVLFGSPRFMDPPLDLCGSHRFFINPGLSSSLMEESRTSMTATSEDAGSTSTSTTTVNDSSTTSASDHAKDIKLPDDSIAVLAYSSSPYEDFQRSMQEMVEAFVHNNGKVDWNFMEELLFCYLNLNEKKSYRYILSAFVDLIVNLRQNSNGFSVRSRNIARSTARFAERSERTRRKTISESK
ncbi:transcription repressor OFP14 [Juglans microcarpa x Juglans regia]|uniref:transcription repressor OFP14 n=1 Tax=Juglans microcarpa x Juglans regia TaxID=2249226 RepID=UPI001B7E2074|nr:transcription repressor OFP14 [Juglans microcarpa x Juglans regia]